jgi:hypothetical protein
MNKNCIITLSCIAVILLTSCSPSPQAIQTAIAETQAALPTLTPTATTTQTATPTATINPCSDRGWADIINYMTQYNLSVKNVQVGSSIFAYIQTLKNYEEKINSVVIDSCTEHARQLVITGLSNQTSAWQSVLTGSITNDMATQLVNSLLMLKDAETELNSLGLHLTFP